MPIYIIISSALQKLSTAGHGPPPSVVHLVPQVGGLSYLYHA